MITVGSVIGSGIFLKPLDISRSLPSPAWIFGAWVAIGVVCLCGALAYAELGAMLPEAGGMYAFIREGWGRFPAFLYGWCLMLVISSRRGGGALHRVRQLARAPWCRWARTRRSRSRSAMILALALVNHVGVRLGRAAPEPVDVRQALVAARRSSSPASSSTAAWRASGAGGAPTRRSFPRTSVGAPTSLLAGLIVASVAIFWAYEGWYALPFNAAELKRPERDLPRGLIWGMLILVGDLHRGQRRLPPCRAARGDARHGLGARGAQDRDRARLRRRRRRLARDLHLHLDARRRQPGAALERALLLRHGARRHGLPGADAVHGVFGTPTVAIWSQAIVGLAAGRRAQDLPRHHRVRGLRRRSSSTPWRWRRSTRCGDGAPTRPGPTAASAIPLTPALFIAAVAFVDVYTLVDPRMRINALYGIGILIVGAVVYFSAGLHRGGRGLHRGGRSTELDRERARQSAA